MAFSTAIYVLSITYSPNSLTPVGDSQGRLRPGLLGKVFESRAPSHLRKRHGSRLIPWDNPKICTWKSLASVGMYQSRVCSLDFPIKLVKIGNVLNGLKV